MQKIRMVLVLAALFSTQALFAEGDMGHQFSKSCKAVAEACKQAGFSGRAFWKDCMKPELLSQNVAKVTLDPATAKACRMDKITEMKKELEEFQGVSS
jgi:hypothetical protein